MKKTLRLTKKNLLASLIAGSIATLAAPNIVWAQTANATLRDTGPANAQVTARNVSTGSVRRTSP